MNTQTYMTVSVLYSHFLIHEECQIGELAIKFFNCLGVEDYSYDEEAVDELLGDRSYSGGDLTEDIYDELQEDARLRKRPIVNFYFENKNLALKFISWLKSLELHLDVKLAEDEVKDWNAFWRKFYKEIDLGHGYKIVPSWVKNEKTLHQDIVIYPGMGFGTGNHETTFLCLKALYERNFKLEKVLDFGCGSGILGIGAIKKKPLAQVDFYDIDQAALENCEENLKLNELMIENYDRLLPSQREKLGQYDLVFANILKHVLEEENKAITDYVKKDGYLILSGLLKEQAYEIKNLYIDSGFSFIERLDKNDWSALVMKKAC